MQHGLVNVFLMCSCLLSQSSENAVIFFFQVFSYLTCNPEGNSVFGFLLVLVMCESKKLLILKS